MERSLVACAASEALPARRLYKLVAVASVLAALVLNSAVLGATATPKSCLPSWAGAGAQQACPYGWRAHWLWGGVTVPDVNRLPLVSSRHLSFRHPELCIWIAVVYAFLPHITISILSLGLVFWFLLGEAPAVLRQLQLVGFGCLVRGVTSLLQRVLGDPRPILSCVLDCDAPSHSTAMSIGFYVLMFLDGALRVSANTPVGFRLQEGQSTPAYLYTEEQLRAAGRPAIGTLSNFSFRLFVGGLLLLPCGPSDYVLHDASLFAMVSGVVEGMLLAVLFHSASAWLLMTPEAAPDGLVLIDVIQRGQAAFWGCLQACAAALRARGRPGDEEEVTPQASEGEDSQPVGTRLRHRMEAVSRRAFACSWPGFEFMTAQPATSMAEVLEESRRQFMAELEGHSSDADLVPPLDPPVRAERQERQFRRSQSALTSQFIRELEGQMQEARGMAKQSSGKVAELKRRACATQQDFDRRLALLQGENEKLREQLRPRSTSQ